MQFKTDMAQDSLLAIGNKLREKFPDSKLELELSATDHVLHIHGLPEDSIHASQVESAVRETGFEASWLQRGLENK